MLAAVLLPPSITLPIAAVIGLVLAWYATRLAQPDVPASRRWIRGVSITLMAMCIGLMLAGFSFLDQKGGPAEARQWAWTWTIAIGLLVLILGTAIADALNSMRLLSRDLDLEALDERRKRLEERETRKA